MLDEAYSAVRLGGGGALRSGGKSGPDQESLRAGRTPRFEVGKKTPPIQKDKRDHREWLPGLDSNQQPSGYK